MLEVDFFLVITDGGRDSFHLCFYFLRVNIAVIVMEVIVVHVRTYLTIPCFFPFFLPLYLLFMSLCSHSDINEFYFPEITWMGLDLDYACYIDKLPEFD